MYSNFQLYPSNSSQPATMQYSDAAQIFAPAFTEPSFSQHFATFYDLSMMIPQMTENTDPQLFLGNSFEMDEYLSTMQGSCLDTMQQLLAPNIIPLSPLTSSSTCSSPSLGEFISMDHVPLAYDPNLYLVAPPPSIETPSSIDEPLQPKGDFRCTFAGCKMVFGRRYNLKSHEVTHNGVRDFFCDHCNKAFVRRHDWKRHVRIHTGETPHRCQYCTKGFSRADGLQRHYTLKNTDCSIKFLHDPCHPLRFKKRIRKTGFGAKSSL